MLRSEQLIQTIRRHRKPIVYTATALALAGAGSASAATALAASDPAAVAAVSRTQASETPMIATALHGSAKLTLLPAASAPRQHAASHVPPVKVTHRRALRHVSRRRHPVRHFVTPADKLMPVGTSGPQSWIPISQAQAANAKTIVRQALRMNMGIRSAVIAVATAMQESKLVNVNYGTGNSLGLFQQQWNMGWGSPQQIMNPAYASDAFLGALKQYQSGDPGWATQPLYQAAQGVQRSAFPYAYAQWEAQAAHLTAQTLPHR